MIASFLEQLTHNYTLQIILVGTAVLGGLSGLLGSFAVLKKQSLLGDAISHAALPGICLSFIITGTKNSTALLLGALISGIIGTVWIRSIITKTHLKSDTALGLILSVFFGFGLLLLTFIQKMPNANQAGLDAYLFGQAATLMLSDVIWMAVVAFIALLVTLVFWKAFKLYLFDVEFAKTLGYPVSRIDFILTSLIVLVIVIGLQTVGVVLMSSLLLAPAAAARQWTNRLWVMVLLAACIGLASGIWGTAISASHSNLSTGPVIVLCASAFVLFSFIFSPKRGILFRQIRLIKNRRDLKLNKALTLMYRIASQHDDITSPHGIRMLNNFRGYSKSTFKKLEKAGWVAYHNKSWSLTQEGSKKAVELYQNPVTDE